MLDNDPVSGFLSAMAQNVDEITDQGITPVQYQLSHRGLGHQMLCEEHARGNR